MQAEIGLIGLGVMGANLALNIAERGFTIAVYNRTWSKTEAFIAEAGPLAKRIIACRTMADLSAAIRAPRPVIIMVKAGEAVDEQISALCEVLGPDDIIIDAGNANFHDTVRRDVQPSPKTGLELYRHGCFRWRRRCARHGPSIMVGGLEANPTAVSKGC